MSNNEFIDITSCRHPILNKKNTCLICGQKLENYNPKKYKELNN